jgi:ribosome-associated heat shock protein Hsp15
MASDAIRLDKWLWQARLCKSRGVAAQTIAAGAVRVNAVRVLKPAAPLRVGDGVTVTLGQCVRVLRVRALGVRRGPAAEARTLYEDLASTPRSLDPDGRLDT